MAPMTHTKRMIKVINTDIDARIDEAKKGGVSALDIAMMDKLLRPFAVMLEVNKQAETPPPDFSSSLTWIMGVILTEAVLNMTPKNQPDQVYAVTNELMKEMSETVTKILASTVDQPNRH